MFYLILVLCGLLPLDLNALGIMVVIDILIIIINIIAKAFNDK